MGCSLRALPSRLGTSADAPYLDMAYKLVVFDDGPRLKLSEGKATWPGEKQVWRLSAGEAWDHDVIGLREEEPTAAGEPLLETVMVEGGRRHDDSLAAARARVEEGRRRLGERHRRLDAQAYEVRKSASLTALRDELADLVRRRHSP
jgi:nicotinate phosphoribosyltransferase